MLDASAIADTLTDRFGLPLRGESRQDKDGLRARLLPADIAHTQGFAIDVLIGWRSIEAAFSPGAFAGALMAGMQSATEQQRAAFRAFVHVIREDSASVTFSVNGANIDPNESASWPAQWRTLSLLIHRGPLVIDHKDIHSVQRLATVWGGRMLGLSLALLPIEQDGFGDAEGGLVRVEVNRYERSAINRAACIEIHGAICQACGFDFAIRYGGLGVGFIEVHHIEPVSGLLPGTIVDPAHDLIPLCANCHAMIHRRTPPLSVAELQAAIRPDGQPR
jgi:5-methylcytosine-specific restriction enzyme A